MQNEQRQIKHENIKIHTLNLNEASRLTDSCKISEKCKILFSNILYLSHIDY